MTDMGERKRLLLEDILEISLVDRPAQRPARVALTKRHALADVERPHADGRDASFDDLALAAYRVAAIAEEAAASSTPETVFNGIQAVAESLRRDHPGLTKEQAVAKALELHPEFEAEYARAARPSTQARQAYLAKLAALELEPLVEAVRQADPNLTPEQALAEAFEAFPLAYRRYQAMVESLPTPIEKAEVGWKERHAALASLVAEAIGTVQKQEDGAPGLTFRDAFRAVVAKREAVLKARPEV